MPAPTPYNVKQRIPAQIRVDQQVFSGDGTIVTPFSGSVVLSKGSAAAITLAPPTAVLDDGLTIEILTTTAQAHVVTCSDGFNAKGSSGTCTFTAAIGNSVTLRAYNGHWYALVSNGVTLA